MERKDEIDFIPIKGWIESERPREKFASKGPGFLSDAELLAILLGTGSLKKSALELGRDLLHEFGSVDKLSRARVKQLRSIKGVGMAKAVRLAAAFEISRRRDSVAAEPGRIEHSRQAVDYLSPRMKDLDHEICYVLFLNRFCEIVGEKQLSAGGVDATIIDPRLLFREALQHTASSLLISHNHPSGNFSPSEQDIYITRKLARGCALLDIKLFDHIIISRNGYYSFADHGMLDQ